MSEDKGPLPDRPSPSQSDDAALKALSEKLEAKRRAKEEVENRQSKDGSNLGKGIQYASEFSAAVLIGAALGYGADKLFNSSPWGLLIGLSFGFAQQFQSFPLCLFSPMYTISSK